MKISLCVTTFNEERYIIRLLDSIVSQTKVPDEVIIMDGGSRDKTVEIITNYQLRITNVKLFVKKGNRPYGRNQSIQAATGDIIAITDAGCALDKNWLLEITKPFADEKVEVVSGYYAGKPQNVFEACLVPYVLVMPDRVNPSSFLPSTRSMAMKKRVWEKLGGFPEKYRWNEDYVFAKTLEKEQVQITFAQKAVVYWFPRETIIEGYKMFYAFAKGDTQAGIWRPKVLVLLARVAFTVCLFTLALVTTSTLLITLCIILFFLYVFWAAGKNYRYVKKPLAWIYLPLWQLVSDIAVFMGSVVGAFQRVTSSFS